MLFYIDAILYIVLSAISMVFIHVTAHTLNPLVALAFTTSVAIIYFHLINIHRIKFIYFKAWQYKTRWTIVMLIITVMWIFTFLSVAINADISVLLVYSVNSLCSFCVYLLKSNPKERIRFLIAILGIVISLTLLINKLLLHASMQHSPETFKLIFYGTITGVSIFAYQKQSFRLAQESHLKATHILAIRFWLLLLITLILMPKTHLNVILIPHVFLNNILLAFSTLILPIYFNQKGIMKIGPDIFSILVGLVPVLIYFLQLIFLHTEFEWSIFIINISICFFLSFPFLWKKILISLQKRS